MLRLSKMEHVPRTRRRALRRSNTASTADDDYHFRLLSGKVAREKKAKKILHEHVNAVAANSSSSSSSSSSSITSSTPLITSATTTSTATTTTTFPPARPGIRRPPKRHSSLYRLLSGRSRKTSYVLFNRLLATLIVVNVVCFVIESIPSIGSETSPFHPWFYALEAFSSSFFLLEYIARVYTAHESKYSRTNYVGRACFARWHYVVTLRACVDLVSCLPFFIELMIPNSDFPTFTWLRLFRLFRILKSEKSVRAFSSVYRVVWYNSEILGVALFIGGILMMATSTLLWYLKPNEGTDGQFESIPATFYLSILMLTGQGTPDGVLPWYTKVIVMLTAVFSVPIFVIPSSMLTWGFEAEAERLMRRKRERRRKDKEAKRKGLEHPESSSSSDDEEGAMTEDEDDNIEAEYDEYENVVLGGIEENDDESKDEQGNQGGMSEEDRKLIKEVSTFFSSADSDGSGSLSIVEFYQYQKEKMEKQQLLLARAGARGAGKQATAAYRRRFPIPSSNEC